jgi:hypothetical protein
LHVLGAVDVAYGRVSARVQERFELEDKRRAAFLARELTFFYRCQTCGCRVSDTERPGGVCSSCRRHPALAAERASRFAARRCEKLERQADRRERELLKKHALK